MKLAAYVKVLCFNAIHIMYLLDILRFNAIHIMYLLDIRHSGVFSIYVSIYLSIRLVAQCKTRNDSQANIKFKMCYCCYLLIFVRLSIYLSIYISEDLLTPPSYLRRQIDGEQGQIQEIGGQTHRHIDRHTDTLTDTQTH